MEAVKKKGSVAAGAMAPGWPHTPSSLYEKRSAALLSTSLCYGRWPYLPPSTEEVALRDCGHIQIFVELELGREVGACSGITRMAPGAPKSDL